MKNKEKKAKKEKIVYIDDNRTISDMSSVGGGFLSQTKKSKKERVQPLQPTPWQTYWSSVRMMFVPMLVVLGLIGFVFLLFYLSMR